LQAQTNPLITDPQVYLQDNQIEIYGTVQKAGLTATANIDLSAGTDSTGQLAISLTSANFGPFPAPPDLKAAVTTMIQEAYLSALGPAATGFRLESVSIADGTMTITGRVK
jgi:uncharacterized protein YpmS